MFLSPLYSLTSFPPESLSAAFADENHDSFDKKSSISAAKI